MWARWMRVARKAAEVQAHVLFFLLYIFALVPLGVVHRGSRRDLTRRPPNGPEWRTREPSAIDLTTSRRQF